MASSLPAYGNRKGGQMSPVSHLDSFTRPDFSVDELTENPLSHESMTDGQHTPGGSIHGGELSGDFVTPRLRKGSKSQSNETNTTSSERSFVELQVGKTRRHSRQRRLKQGVSPASEKHQRSRSIRASPTHENPEVAPPKASPQNVRRASSRSPERHESSGKHPRSMSPVSPVHEEDPSEFRPLEDPAIGKIKVPATPGRTENSLASPTAQSPMTKSGMPKRKKPAPTTSISVPGVGVLPLAVPKTPHNSIQPFRHSSGSHGSHGLPHKVGSLADRDTSDIQVRELDGMPESSEVTSDEMSSSHHESEPKAVRKRSRTHASPSSLPERFADSKFAEAQEDINSVFPNWGSMPSPMAQSPGIEVAGVPTYRKMSTIMSSSSERDLDFMEISRGDDDGTTTSRSVTGSAEATPPLSRTDSVKSGLGGFDSNSSPVVSTRGKQLKFSMPEDDRTAAKSQGASLTSMDIPNLTVKVLSLRDPETGRAIPPIAPDDCPLEVSDEIYSEAIGSFVSHLKMICRLTSLSSKELFDVIYRKHKLRFSLKDLREMLKYLMDCVDDDFTMRLWKSLDPVRDSDAIRQIDLVCSLSLIMKGNGRMKIKTIASLLKNKGGMERMSKEMEKIFPLYLDPLTLRRVLTYALVHGPRIMCVLLNYIECVDDDSLFRDMPTRNFDALRTYREYIHGFVKRASSEVNRLVRQCWFDHNIDTTTSLPLTVIFAYIEREDIYTEWLTRIACAFDPKLTPSANSMAVKDINMFRPRDHVVSHLYSAAQKRKIRRSACICGMIRPNPDALTDAEREEIRSRSVAEMRDADLDAPIPRSAELAQAIGEPGVDPADMRDQMIICNPDRSQFDKPEHTEADIFRQQIRNTLRSRPITVNESTVKEREAQVSSSNDIGKSLVSPSLSTIGEPEHTSVRLSPSVAAQSSKKRSSPVTAQGSTLSRGSTMTRGSAVTRSTSQAEATKWLRDLDDIVTMLDYVQGDMCIFMHKRTQVFNENQESRFNEVMASVAASNLEEHEDNKKTLLDSVDIHRKRVLMLETKENPVKREIHNKLEEGIHAAIDSYMLTHASDKAKRYHNIASASHSRSVSIDLRRDSRSMSINSLYDNIDTDTSSAMPEEILNMPKPPVVRDFEPYNTAALRFTNSCIANARRQVKELLEDKEKQRKFTKIEKMLKQTEELEKAEDWDGLVAIFEKVLALDLHHKETLCRFAKLLTSGKRLESFGLAKEPTNASSDGDAMIFESMQQMAEEMMHRALTSSVTPDPFVMCTIGEYLLSVESQLYKSMVLGLNPQPRRRRSLAEAIISESSLKQKLGDSPKTHFQDALKADPHFSKALVGLGWCALVEAMDYDEDDEEYNMGIDEADQYFRRVLTNDPENREAQIGKTRCRAMRGDELSTQAVSTPRDEYEPDWEEEGIPQEEFNEQDTKKVPSRAEVPPSEKTATITMDDMSEMELPSRENAVFSDGTEQHDLDNRDTEGQSNGPTTVKSKSKSKIPINVERQMTLLEDEEN